MGELVKYNWERIIGGGSSDDIKCSNKRNTCGRALCECDLDYAKKVMLDLRFNTSNSIPRSSWEKLHTLGWRLNCVSVAEKFACIQQ